MYPADLKYTESHEWIRVDGDTATIGVTFHAQEEIQEVVYVELPEVGTKFAREDEFGVIESVKSAFGLYTPAAGEIAAINEGLEDNPQWVNESPYEQGWMIQIRLKDPSELDSLMSAEKYQAMLEAEAEG